MWDERFNRDEYVYGEEPNDFLRQQAALLKAGEDPLQVLCLAEGEGRNAVWLAEQGHEVMALDLSAVGLEKARQLAQRRGVSITTLRADLGEWDGGEAGPASQDLVVMIFAHTPPAIRERVFALVDAVLKPGGLMLLEGYTPAQIGRGTGGPGDAAMMFSLPMLEAAFDGYEVLVGQERVRDIQEGLFHTGEGAVVQWLARKPRN